MSGTSCQVILLRQLQSTCLRANWMTIGTMWALKATEASSAYLHTSIKYQVSKIQHSSATPNQTVHNHGPRGFSLLQQRQQRTVYEIWRYLNAKCTNMGNILFAKNRYISI